jgi:N-sulfoglucosamine sulfohydrolase
VDVAREDNLPYPMRALRTTDFLYIRNFEPDRWPMGMPGAALTREALESGALEMNTRIGYADFDSGPTKAWLITHRDDPKGKWFYDLSFGKRPAEELYDVRKDPDQIKNLAADPAYAATKKELAARLMKTLVEANDPRVTGDGKTFERMPFTVVMPAPRPNSPR